MRGSECCIVFFFFSSRRRHTISPGDWSSDVCSSDLGKTHMDFLANLVYFCISTWSFISLSLALYVAALFIEETILYPFVLSWHPYQKSINHKSKDLFLNSHVYFNVHYYPFHDVLATMALSEVFKSEV